LKEQKSQWKSYEWEECKKKILHVLWSGGIGGTEEYIINLLRHFDYSRFEIHVCFLSEKGLIYKEASTVKDIRVFFLDIKSGYDLFGTVRFARYLCRNKFDLIHSHMRNFLSTAILSLFAFRTPKILTHHLGSIDLRHFRKNRLFYKIFSRNFERIIAISFAVKDNLNRDFDVKETDKIKVIHNGIDLNKFDFSRPLPSGTLSIKKEGSYVFGFVGRMESYKRPVLFVQVALELLKKKKNLYFIMVGDGPELKRCDDLIKEHDMEGYFHLFGFRRDIPNILRLTDAFIFTSAGEGFGIVLLEAMAMRSLVFAVNEGAVREIIRHDKNGILLNTTDPGSIADNIVRVIENRDYCENIRENALMDVRSRFSIEACAEKLENLYGSILNRAEKRL
jgi:glycosyltransferase involved in cell wall biosynthesis